MKKGNTRECLDDYFSTLSWSVSAALHERKPICDFVGVDPAPVRKWYIERYLPVGITLVKLRYFLESIGYQVSELENLNQSVRDLGRLICHGIVSVEEAVTELMLPSHSQLLRLLHGTVSGLASERMSRLEQICEIYERETAELVQKIPKKWAVKPVTHGASISAHSNQVTRPDSHPNTRNGDGLSFEDEVIHLLHILDSDCKLVGPRLQRMVDEFTPEQRANFRETASPDLVFRLSNRIYAVYKQLGALSSEKALEITKSQNA